MSKGHKKRYRAQDAFSIPPKKSTPDETSKPDEPIKLERVRLRDEFYWIIPGDVPGGHKRYGMRLAEPAVPEPDASTESSIPTSTASNPEEELASKIATGSNAPIDTAIQDRNSTTDQVEKATGTPLADNKDNIKSSLQDQQDTPHDAADLANQTLTETRATVDASMQAPTESKIKVAASILARTDTANTDTAHHARPPATTADVKGETRLAHSQQQTVIANRRIEPEQAVSPSPKYVAQKDKRSSWRPAWIALLLLLALGGVLYDALFNNDEKVTSVVKPEQQPVVEHYQPEQNVQAQVAEKAAVANAETGQVKQVYFITHVVVKGDTLWDISKKYLNDPFRYPELAQLSNIKNPDLIYPGDIVTIPMTQTVERVQAQVADQTVMGNVETDQLKQIRFITHVVVKGDTLWDISKKYLDNPYRYPEVAKLSNIKNPDLIYPGDIVRIQI